MIKKTYNHLFCFIIFIISAQISEGSLEATPRITLETKYTDNAGSAVRGQEKDDLILTARPGVNITNRGGRSSIDFDGSFTYDKYTKDNSLSTESQNLALSSNLNLIPRRFVVNANAAYTTLQRNSRDNLTADNRVTNKSKDERLIYSINPIFYTRHKEWVSTTNGVTYSESQENPFQGSSTNGQENNTSETFNFDQDITSGRSFNRLSWNLNNRYAHSKRSGGQSAFISKGSALSGEYAITRPFALTGTIGYEDVNDAKSGLHWLAGGHLRGTRTDLVVEHGRRYQSQTWSGSLSYELTPRWSLTGSYTDVVETEEAARLDRLRNNNVAIGGLVDPITGLPVSLTDSEFQDNNETIRRKSLTLNLNGTRGRNTYNFGTTQTQITSTSDTGRDQKIGSYTFSFTRRLTPKADFNLGGSFSSDRSAQSDNRKVYRANTGYTYRLGERASLGLNYSFLYEDSSTSSDKKENIVTLSFTKTF